MDKTFAAGKLAYENLDFKNALALLLPVAEQGHPHAQYFVGKLLFAGLEVGQDLKQAASWYLKSAANEFAPAQYELAKLYEYGICFEQKLDQALAWYTKEAKANHPLAQGQLRLLQLQSQPDDAVVQAANAKDKYALYILAIRQYAGKGEIPDIQTALTNFKAAAAQGLAEAQYRLGMMVAKGEGMAQNYVQALGYFRSAAKQGHPLAQYQLGRMYGTGQALPQDKTAALALFMLSKINGNPQPIGAALPAEDWKQAKTLLKELSKPGNFLVSLESHQAQRQQKNVAIATAMWTGYTAANASKKSAKKQEPSRFPRKVFIVIAAIAGWLFMRLPTKPPVQQSYDQTACAAPPFASAQEKKQAKEAAQFEGYEINEQLSCIDKPSYDKWRAEKAAYEQRQTEQLADKRQELAQEGKSDLA